MKTGADLPECLVNHILSYRPTHPVARLVQNPDIYSCYRMSEYWRNIWDMCWDFGELISDIYLLIERRDRELDMMNLDGALETNNDIVQAMAEHGENMKIMNGLLDGILCGDSDSDPRKIFKISEVEDDEGPSLISTLERDNVFIENLSLKSGNIGKKWSKRLDKFSDGELLSVFNSHFREMTVEMRLSV